MNEFPTAAQIARLKEQYPEGTRLVLTADMDDPAPITAGARGTSRGVDDAGQIMMAWDTGRDLSLIPSKDSFRKLTRAETIKEQCKAAAATGQTNMFDAKAAFEIALDMGFGELAGFIFMDSKRYSALILTGDLEDKDLIQAP